MGAIYLVRHGQASFGAENYDLLSPLGEEQSRFLGRWMRDTGQPLSQVVLGTATRHRQTAEHCLQVFGGDSGEWQVERGFDEFDHHEVLVRYRPELADRAAFGQLLAGSDNPRREFQRLFAAAVARWISGDFDADYSESWPAFQQRCQQALRQLAEKTSQDIWVFTSGGAISAMVQGVTGIPDSRIFEINWTLLNTGVTKLLYQPGRISLSYLNNPAHLEIHRRPELITYR